MTAPRLLVIIPAWNEEETVAAVIDEVSTALRDADVLVVDDGSIDATAAKAKAAGAPVLSLPYNLGVGGALRAGFRYAKRHGYDVAVQVDADGQHDPNEVRRLVEALGEADLVVGARFAGKGEYQVRGPRRWAMRVLAWWTSRIAHTKLTDATSGFRAANRRAIALFAYQYPQEYMGDTVEALVMAARSGLVVRQVPVVMRERQGGTASQSPFKATAYLVRALLVLLLATIRKRPTLDVRAMERRTP